MDASGRALVTGASRGLGRALAVELARAGFEVVASMRDPSAGAGIREEAGDAGVRIRVERLDVLDPDSIHIPEGLRVLVNNAGVDAAYLPVEETPMEQWRHVFETNFFGVLETTRRAIPELRRRGGVICNVTTASLLFPMPFFAVYRASKGAVSVLGESLRAELAPHGIRLVEVMPGPIETDMLAASDRSPEARAQPPYREMAERAHARRQSVEGPVTSPQQASRAIVAAVLDDAAPLRIACDPLGEGLLAGWRGASDEDWMRSMLGQLGASLDLG